MLCTSSFPGGGGLQAHVFQDLKKAYTCLWYKLVVLRCSEEEWKSWPGSTNVSGFVRGTRVFVAQGILWHKLMYVR